MTPRLDPRDLDRRLVPEAARRLRTLLDSAADGRRRAGTQLRRAATAVQGAARRADDRATATGPLAILRDVPQLGLVVVAAVLLSAAAAAVVLDEPDPAPSASAGTAGLDAVVRLGVPPGGDVELYLGQIRVVLDDVAQRLPETELLAVVHLSRYVGPAELFTLLEGTAAQRVYLRAPTAGPEAEIVSAPVEPNTALQLLPPLCQATSTRKAEDARNFTALADSVEPTTPEEQAAEADFRAEAQRAGAESAAFAAPCTTSFAAVVQGSAAALRALVDRDGVRGVEPAPTGVALADLDIQPLMPETTGVVPTGRER